MSSEIRRLRKRQLARDTLKKLFENSDTVLIIHYSCESFFKYEDGNSPKIASISVRNLESGDVHSFSIHHYAEKNKIAQDKIVNSYLAIEKQMLSDFFLYVSDHFGFTWAHWNMRNINFGFQALEHRFAVLGGDPRIISDNRKVDISRLMHEIYGVTYAEKPVLVNVCQLNDIESDLFMSGVDEAAAFELGEFRSLHQSTLKKVDFISYVAELALENKLKTNTTWIDHYGIHPRVIVELVRAHWVFGVLAVFAVIFGVIRFIKFMI